MEIRQEPPQRRKQPESPSQRNRIDQGIGNADRELEFAPASPASQPRRALEDALGSPRAEEPLAEQRRDGRGDGTPLCARRHVQSPGAPFPCPRRADGGTRTLDPRFTRAVLHQLSYVGEASPRRSASGAHHSRHYELLHLPPRVAWLSQLRGRARFRVPPVFTMLKRRDSRSRRDWQGRDRAMAQPGTELIRRHGRRGEPEFRRTRERVEDPQR
jgi:hypothetical protein